MAKLILSLDDVVLQDIPLTKERTTIGRKPHNDIHIDNLAVSGEHAVITTIMNDCILEDLGSTNGTLVNGVLAKRHVLRNNDLIELGKYKLKFVGVAPAAATQAPTPADYEKTMVWRPGTAKPPAGVPGTAGPTAGPPHAPPHVASPIPVPLQTAGPTPAPAHASAYAQAPAAAAGASASFSRRRHVGRGRVGRLRNEGARALGRGVRCQMMMRLHGVSVKTRRRSPLVA